MAVMLAAWCVLGLCSLPLGRALLGEGVSDRVDRLVASLWTGMLALAALLLTVSLVMPLQPAGGALIVAGSLAGLVLLLRRPLDISAAETIALAAILVGVAAAASGTVGLFDAGLYQLQITQMLGRYGTLPGAALLHFRFAFSSSWLALTAALDPPFLAGLLTPAATGLVAALATLHFCSALWRIGAGSADRGCWYLAGAYPIVFYDAMLQTSVISPSPNFAVAFSLVLAGWACFQESRSDAMLVSAAGASLKLTFLPAVLCAAVFDRGHRKQAVWIATAGVLPLLAANFIASGCPAFPAEVCIPGPHTFERAAAIAVDTRNWARFGGPYPADASFLNVSWIPGWIARTDKVLLAAGLAGLVAVLAKRALNAAAVMAAAGLLFVLATAPDTRFLTGYLAILTGCAAAAFARALPAIPGALTRPWIWGVLGMFMWLGYAVARDVVRPEKQGAGWPSRLVIPCGPRSAPVSPWDAPPGIQLLHPNTADQCWNAPFPCVPYPPEPAARLCDPLRGLTAGVCAKGPR